MTAEVYDRALSWREETVLVTEMAEETSCGGEGRSTLFDGHTVLVKVIFCQKGAATRCC